MRGAIFVFFTLVACGADLSHAVLTVEDPDGVATGAVALGVGQNLDELERKDLDGRLFPVTIALSTDKRRYEGEVWVDAFDANGVTLGRGVSKADIKEDNPSTVLVTLARPCLEDVDCDDGIFCNGIETCGDRTCLKVEEPCRIGAFACVNSACLEEEDRCNVLVNHTLCTPILRPDGSETPTYCDPATGCAPGKSCYTEEDCQDASFCNGRERCEAGRCIGGITPDITDEDVCNIDACIEPEGEAHFPDLRSDGRPCTDASIEGNAICLASVCTRSICGDLVVDTRIEDCEDDNDNPSDACHLCRATIWEPVVIAGLGEASGDPKLLALNFPFAVAVNARGDLFVAEATGARILRIDAAASLVTTYAGTGRAAYTGDFGPAIAADIGLPISVTIDGADNLYLLDSTYEVVRRVDGETGTISTVAGGGTDAPSWDVPATSVELIDARAIAVDGLGDLWIAHASSGEVIKVSIDTGSIVDVIGGLGVPENLSVDALGTVWVADSGYSEISRIDPDGFPETVLGSEEVTNPIAVAVNRDGLVYVVERGSNRVREFDVESAIDQLYAGTGVSGSSGDGGPARDAKIDPSNLAITLDGDLIIVESTRQRVRRISSETLVIDTIAGSGVLGPGLTDIAGTSLPFLSFLGGLAVAPSGAVYFSELAKHLLLSAGAGDGVITVIAGEATAIDPRALALDSRGDLYFADVRMIRKIDGNSRVITTVAGNGTAGTCMDNVPAIGACFGEVNGIAFDADDNLYASDAFGGRISKIDLAAGTITRVADFLNAPIGVAVRGGDLYFAERNGHRVRKRDALGVYTVVAGTGVAGYIADGIPADTAPLSSPAGIAIDSLGRVVIADRGNQRIRRVELDNTITTVAGTGSQGSIGDGYDATAAQLYGPTDVAIGPGDSIYVLSEGAITGSIRRIDRGTNVITTVVGGIDPLGDGFLDRSRLGSASALSLVGGTADRPVWWIADGGTGRVREVDTPNSVVRSVAGYPDGFSGEDIAARWSRLLENPSGIAYDTVNELVYVAERDGHVIRRIDLSISPPSIRTYAGLLGAARHIDGPVDQSRFYAPAGLMYDALTKELYVADSGNHVIRVIDTAAMTPTVRTIAGTPGVRGFSGDGGDAFDALFDTPVAMALAGDGSVYVADSNNHRVRRILSNRTIETIFGDGEPANSGTGSPARYFPVKAPSGLVVDRYGNLFVASPEAIRRVASGADALASGEDEVSTVFGAPPRTNFPEAVTRCLTGLALIQGRGAGDAADLFVLDACQGFLIRLQRGLH